MILKIFSVYDTKAESYIQPFYAPTCGVAVRNFEAAANEEGHAFHKHSADYGLFELGEFDDANGKITRHEQPISLGLAQTLILPMTPPVSDPTQLNIREVK